MYLSPANYHIFWILDEYMHWIPVYTRWNMPSSSLLSWNSTNCWKAYSHIYDTSFYGNEINLLPYCQCCVDSSCIWAELKFVVQNYHLLCSNLILFLIEEEERCQRGIVPKETLCIHVMTTESRCANDLSEIKKKNK